MEYRLAFPVETRTWNGKAIGRAPRASVEATLDALAANGIDRVMFAGYVLEEPSEFDPDEESRAVGRAFAARGFSGAQHHALAPCFAPAGRSQGEVVFRIKRCVDFTVNLGAGVMVLHLDKVLGSPGDSSAQREWVARAVAESSLDDVLARIRDNLHAAGEYAERHGVKIALENLDRFSLFGGLRLLPGLVEGACSPAVGFCLDSGHAWCAGVSPLAWIDRMKGRIFATHIHDNHGAPDWVRQSDGLIASTGIDEHLPPGFGTIPWTWVIRALRQSGYRDTLTFESGPWPGLPEREGYRRAIAYWRTCEHLAAGD